VEAFEQRILTRIWWLIINMIPALVTMIEKAGPGSHGARRFLNPHARMNWFYQYTLLRQLKRK